MRQTKPIGIIELTYAILAPLAFVTSDLNRVNRRKGKSWHEIPKCPGKTYKLSWTVSAAHSGVKLGLHPEPSAARKPIEASRTRLGSLKMSPITREVLRAYASDALPDAELLDLLAAVEKEAEKRNLR